MDVESTIMTSNYVSVLKETNDLIKEIESAGHLEQLQSIGDDVREREQQTKEFNKMFEEHHIDDVDYLFKQFEREVNDEDELNAVPKAKEHVVQVQHKEEVVQPHSEQHKQEEHHEREETHEKLLALA